MGEKFLWGKFLKKLPAAVRHAYALVLIIIGWVLLRSGSLAQVGQMVDVYKRQACILLSSADQNKRKTPIVPSGTTGVHLPAGKLSDPDSFPNRSSFSLTRR